MIFPLKMVIFHSYVKLPEGNWYDSGHNCVIIRCFIGGTWGAATFKQSMTSSVDVGESRCGFQPPVGAPARMDLKAMQQEPIDWGYLPYMDIYGGPIF